jgi:hypothetical protein
MIKRAYLHDARSIRSVIHIALRKDVERVTARAFFPPPGRKGTNSHTMHGEWPGTIYDAERTGERERRNYRIVFLGSTSFGSLRLWLVPCP